MRNKLTTWIGLAAVALTLSCGEKENPMGGGLVDTDLSSSSDTVVVFPITEAASFQFICPSADEECDRGGGGSTELLVGSGYGYRAVTAFSFESVAVDTGVVVDSAFMRLTAARPFSGAPVDLTVHALLDTLLENEVFFGDSLAFDPTPLPATLDYGNNHLRIDLTEVVAGWRTNENLRGLVLASHDPGPSFAHFLSYEASTFSDTSSVRPMLFIYQHDKGDTATAFSYADPVNDTWLLWWDPLADSLSSAEDRLTIGKGLASRSLLKADISSIPAEATINRARLVLWVDPSQSAFDTLQTVAHLVADEWAGAQTEFSATTLALGWAFPDVDSAEVNVTGLVQIWTADLLENHGIMLKCYGETDNIDFVRFFDLSGPGDSAPTLIVEYSLPPLPWFRQ